MSTLVAVAQFAAGTDKETNLDSCRALVSKASAAGAKLVVLPENAMYHNHDVTADISADVEELDGNFTKTIRALSAEHRITVVAGMTERIADSHRHYNTLVVAGPDGELVTRYRKVHLYDAFGYRESDKVQAADFEAVTFEVDGVTYGVMTCYDVRFPEMARLLVDAGADAIVLPAAWAAGPLKEDHWRTLVRARAIENTVYVLAAGQNGSHCTGNSIVVDPMGVVIGDAGEVDGIGVGVIDRARITTVRAKNPSLTNRRLTITA